MIAVDQILLEVGVNVEATNPLNPNSEVGLIETTTANQSILTQGVSFYTELNREQSGLTLTLSPDSARIANLISHTPGKLAELALNPSGVLDWAQDISSIKLDRSEYEVFSCLAQLHLVSPGTTIGVTPTQDGITMFWWGR